MLQILSKRWSVLISSPLKLCPIILSVIALCLSNVPIQAAEKWAVLIGIDKYADAAKLNYAASDQKAIHQAFLQADFDQRKVVLLSDQHKEIRYQASKANIEQEIFLACGAANKEDMVLISFSGYCRYLQGKGYICPMDSDLNDASTMIDVDWIYEQLKNSPAALKICVIDAGRDAGPQPVGKRHDNSVDRSRELDSFLEFNRKQVPEGIIVHHSCSKGEQAKESAETGGVFTHFFLQGLQDKADIDGNGRISLGELMDFSNRETTVFVKDKYRALQRPEDIGSFTQDARDFNLITLNTPKESRSASSLSASEPSTERMDAKPTTTLLSNSSNSSPTEPLPKTFTNSLGMELVLIPAGTFMMGSPESEAGRGNDETQHEVTLSQPYYLGATEVIRGQFGKFVNATGYRTVGETDATGSWGTNET